MGDVCLLVGKKDRDFADALSRTYEGGTEGRRAASLSTGGPDHRSVLGEDAPCKGGRDGEQAHEAEIKNKDQIRQSGNNEK